MHSLSRSISMLGVAVTLVACSTKETKEGGKEAAPAVTVPPTAAGHASRGTISEMAWIMGSFRGTGVQGTVQAPFFERYSAVGDSTLVVESFKDSTFGGTPDSARYVLRGDSLTNGEAAATTVSPGSVTFVSRKQAGLAWTWRREGDGNWTAIIVNSVPNGPPTTRSYQMMRVK